MNRFSTRGSSRGALRSSLSLVLSAVVALCAVQPLVSCHAPTTKYPVERTIDADSERILWDALRLAIHENKYKVGGGADPGTREIRSAWKLDLAPFKGDGFRSRVIATYVPGDGERKGVTSTVATPGLEAFDVTVRVEMETNESLSPLNLDRAKWTPADDSEALARKVLQDLSSLLGTSSFELEKRENPFGIE